MRETDIRSHSGKICDAQIARQRLPVGFSGAFHVVSLLRQSGQLPRIAYERVAAHAITVSKLNGLALAGHVAMTFRLAKRVGASIEILKAINKGARKTQKRIGPVAPQLRRFTKCGNGVGQIPLSFGKLMPGAFGFTIDPAQVPFAITQRRS